MTEALVPRDCQQRLPNETLALLTDDVRRVLVQAATGAGKVVLIAMMAALAHSMDAWVCGCGCINPLGRLTCAECGADRPAAPRIEADPRVSLVWVNPVEPHKMLPRRMRGPRLSDIHRQPRSLEELRAFREVKKYKPGWVYYARRQQAEIFGVWPR
jgi:hypothetical protein